MTLPGPRLPHLKKSNTLDTGFVVPSTFSVVLEVSVEFSRVEVFLLLSYFPSLEEFSIRCQSTFFPLPSSAPTLEYTWLSHLAPLRFICNPSLSQSQSTSQLFGSINVTPIVFAIQSYLSFNAPMRRHDTSARNVIPLDTLLDCGNLILPSSQASTTHPPHSSHLPIALEYFCLRESQLYLGLLDPCYPKLCEVAPFQFQGSTMPS